MTGVVILAIALISLLLNARSFASSGAQEDEIKVAQPRFLLLACLLGVLCFGALATLAFQSSPSHAMLGTFILLAAAAVCVAGVLFFGALVRTSAGAGSALMGESILAEGMGRMSNSVRGQIVVATDRRIASLPARLVSKPAVAASIPYETIRDFEGHNDSLVVQGRVGYISLKKCAPKQIDAITAELQRHVVTGQGMP